MKWVILMLVGFVVIAGAVYVGVRMADERKEQIISERQRNALDRKLARDNLTFIGECLSRYYEKHNAAPTDLNALASSGDLPASSLTCPLKGYRYIFVGYVAGSNKIAVYELSPDGVVHDALTADGMVWPATKEEVASGSIGVDTRSIFDSDAPKLHSIFNSDAAKEAPATATIAQPAPHEFGKTPAEPYRSREDGPESYQDKTAATIHDAQSKLDRAKLDAETLLANDPAYRETQAAVDSAAANRKSALAKFGPGSAEVLEASSKWVAALERQKAIVGKDQAVQDAQKALDATRR